MLHYVKLILIFLWLSISSIYGIFLTFIHWRDRKLNYHLARLISFGILKICGIRVVVDGAEYLEGEGPRILVGNHQHALDVPIYGAFIPQNIVMTAKREMLWVPFFGVLWYAAGNRFIHRQKHTKAVQQISEIAEIVREENAATLIFPEGTRNRSMRGVLPFKKGPFYLAIETGAPIVPILVPSLLQFFTESGKFTEGGELRVTVLPPIVTDELTTENVNALTTRVRAQFVEILGEHEGKPRSE